MKVLFPPLKKGAQGGFSYNTYAIHPHAAEGKIIPERIFWNHLAESAGDFKRRPHIRLPSPGKSQANPNPVHVNIQRNDQL